MLTLLFYSTSCRTSSHRTDYPLSIYTATSKKGSTTRKVSTDINSLTTFLVQNGVDRASAESFTKKLKFSKNIGTVKHTFNFVNYEGRGDPLGNGFRTAQKVSKVIQGAKNGNNYAIEITTVDGSVPYENKYKIDYKKKRFLRKTKHWTEWFWRTCTSQDISNIEQRITAAQQKHLNQLSSKRVAI